MTTTSPIKSIQARWWIVVLLAVLGGIAGYLPKPEKVAEQATSFTATNTMLSNDGGDASIVTPNQVVLLATVGEVPQRVAEEIGYPGNAAQLASQVTVNFDFESGALTITTSQSTAEQAEVVANAFAEQLNRYLAERQNTVYQDRLDAANKRLDDSESELDDVTTQLAADPLNPTLLAQQDALSRQYSSAFEQVGQLENSPGQLVFTTLQSAQAVPVVDEGLSAPASRTTRAAMGFVVGAVLGVALALLLGYLDRKIRSREQAEDLVGLRARVMIPKVRHTEGGVVVSAGRHDALSDSYRTVRNVVGFIQGGLEPTKRARITLIVSPGPGDGKTSLTANLAAAFMELGQRTIAVNTDFRRPRLHTALTGSPAPELPYELDELDDLPRRALPLDTTSDNMKILDLSSIPGSPGQLVRATARQVERLADGTDQILIDSSPVGATAEVLDLVPLADTIVLVTRLGHTSITSAERTIAILRDIAEAPIVFVLSGMKSERNPYHEYSDPRAAPKRSRGKEAEATAGTGHEDVTEPVERTVE